MKTHKIEIGANILDIDLRTAGPAETEALQQALYENRIIILKGQQFSEQDFVDFAYKFGAPVPFLQSHYNHPDYPLIFVSSNVKQQDGRQIGVARTGGYWLS